MWWLLPIATPTLWLHVEESFHSPSATDATLPVNPQFPAIFLTASSGSFFSGFGIRVKTPWFQFALVFQGFAEWKSVMAW
jgi:hypothetical protein